MLFRSRDSRHDHHPFESHLHRSRVVLPDSTELTAVSFGSVNPCARDVPPDFGLYLDERWRPPRPHEYLDWPDFGVPDDPVLVVAALEALTGLGRANTSRSAVTAATVAPVQRLPVSPSSAGKRRAKQSAGSAPSTANVRSK